jgi:hypothetical protein
MLPTTETEPAPPAPVYTPQLIAHGTLAGWRTLWIKFVNGFDPTCHCQNCLLGWTLPSLRQKIVPGTPMGLGPGMPGTRKPWGWGRRGASLDYDAIYLCGVHQSWVWSKNLHLVAVPDPESVAEITASTGTLFRIAGARRVEIRDLPADYDGRNASFTTCRNWRFGVAYYGLDPMRQAFDPHGQRGGLPAT